MLARQPFEIICLEVLTGMSWSFHSSYPSANRRSILSLSVLRSSGMSSSNNLYGYGGESVGIGVARNLAQRIRSSRLSCVGVSGESKEGFSPVI